MEQLALAIPPLQSQIFLFQSFVAGAAPTLPFPFALSTLEEEPKL